MSPLSAVRMRMASSMGMTKIRPSPISPVCADLMMACTGPFSAFLSRTTMGDKDALDGTGVVHDTTVDTGIAWISRCPVHHNRRTIRCPLRAARPSRPRTWSFRIIASILFHTLKNLRLDNLRFTICLSVCVNHRFFILET